MNNFTRSKGNAYWHAITNLTCCSIDLKRMQLFKTFLVLMLFAFSSTSMFAQNRTTFYEVCLADRPEGLTEEQAVALFPNAECDGTLTTVKTEELQGTDCGWVSTYTYELFCDDKSLGLEEKLVYEGGDLEAPKLEVPADVTVECDNIPAVGTPTATDNCDDDVEITYDGEIRIGDDDCLYQLQRTWTAIDNCGLTTTLSQTITVQDTKGPELNKGAKVPTGETGLNVCYDQRPDGPSADYIASLFSDNCGDVKVEKEPVFKGTDCMWKGYINYYITDSCGNPGDTITLYYNGGDTEAPVFVDPPADITVSCIDQIPANYALAWTDNCSVSDPKSKNIGVDDTSELGEACQGGVMTRTWEAQDACGNKVTHTQTITVEPAPPAAFDELADLEIKCEELASFEAGQLYYSNGGSGACDISGYAQGVAEDFSDNCGSFTVTYTYNDTCNSLEYVQTVTVIDDVKPELTIPADVTVQCDAVPGLGEVSASDNCDTNVEIKYDGEVRTDGNCADSYTLTRTWTATDNCNNSTTLSQTITVVDTTAPELTIPADVTVQCDAVPAPGEASATDNCDADVTVSYIDEKREDGDCADSYFLFRVWQATDNCGNTTLKTQQITVIDTVAPVISGVDADYTVECPDAPLFSNPTASDTCDADVDLQYNDVEDLDQCGLGTITRTWTATDNCGNSSQASQTITIQDTVAPEIKDVGADMKIECPEQPVFSEPTVIEDCDKEYSFGYTDKDDRDECGLGSITRTWTATDCAGNSSSASQTITIEDNVAPEIIGVGDDMTIDCPNQPEFSQPYPSDACDQEPMFDYVDSSNLDDCGLGTVTRTWTATDCKGNSSSASQTITIQDITDPVLTVPADETVQCDAIPSLGVATATDTCDNDVHVKFVEERTEPGACENSYTIFRIWLATDCANNSVLGTQEITVVDTTAPVFAGVGDDDKIECPAQPVFSEPTASDNCDADVTITFVDKDDRDECGLGNVTRTWTATDNCGNSSEASQTITVEDNVAPEIIGVGDDYTVECPDSPVFSEPTVKDDCDGSPDLRYEDTPNLDDCGLGTITRTWYATDCKGNMSSDSQTITIDDTVAPEITDVQADYTVECPEALVWSEPTVKDDCDQQPKLEYNDDYNLDDCGLGTVTRTWTATDCKGNMSTDSQTITIDDTVAPVISGVGADMKIECPEQPVFSQPTATDACDSAPSLTFVDDDKTDDCGLGSITRTWTATDCKGNSSTASQTITIEDNVAPVIDGVGEDFMVECPDEWSFSEPTATDECSGNSNESNKLLFDFESGDLAPDWDYIGIALADGAVDNVNPAGGSYQAYLATGNEGDQDFGAISPVASVADIETFLGLAPGALVNISNQSDAYEGSAMKQNMTVNAGDEITFDWTFLTNEEIESSCDDTAFVLLIEDGVVVLANTFTPGNTPNVGGNFYQYTTGAQSFSHTFNNGGNCVLAFGVLDVCDTIVDSALLVDNVSIGSTGGGVSLTYEDVEDLDDCGLGTITRTWTAKDCAGNSSTASQTVTIKDTVAPVISGVGDDYSVECPDGPVFSEPTAKDDCDAQPKIEFVDEDKTDECGLGDITRTWTATDCAGNSSTASQTITIYDATDPYFNEALPQDVREECDKITPAAILTASDACDTDVKVEFTEVKTDGDCPGEYTLTRTWTAADCAGNDIEHVQTVTVFDETAPEEGEGFLLPPSISDINACQDAYLAPPMTEEEFALMFTDNCSNVVVTLFSSPVGNNCGWSIIHIYTVADDCGNVLGDYKVYYSGEDLTAPELVGLPADTTIECTDDIPLAANVSAVDTCDDDVKVDFNESKVNYDCAGNYDILRTWTAMDDCYNTVSHTQTIQVRDNEAPVLVGVLPEGSNENNMCAPDTDNELAALGVLTEAEFAALYNDSCSGVNVTRKINLNGDDCKWIMDVLYTITDDCGNEAQPVKVWYHGADMTAPEPSGQCENETIEIYTSQYGVCPADATFVYDDEITASSGQVSIGGLTFDHSNLKPCFTDNCATQDELTFVVTGTDESDPNTCSRIVTITFDVLDNCENAYKGFVCTFVLIDDVAPAITKADDVLVECDGTDDAFEAWLANNGNHTATDCNKVTWTNDYNTCSQQFTDRLLTSEADFSGNEELVDFEAMQEGGFPTGQEYAAQGVHFSNSTGFESFTYCEGIGLSMPFVNPTEINITFDSKVNRVGFDAASADFDIDMEVICMLNGNVIATDILGANFTCQFFGMESELGFDQIILKGTADAQTVGRFLIDNLRYEGCDSGVDYGQTNPCSQSTTVTFTATDECGNSSSTTSTFTVEDITAPEFTDADCGTTVELDFGPDEGPGEKAGFTSLGWYNGSWYYLSDAAMPATQALPDALANGGYAATINNADENTHVYNAVVAAAGGNIRYYIGYTDTAQEGVFVWQDGDTSTYTNWHSGEPNNAGSEDCAEVGFFGSSTWNDINCVNQSNRYVLEVKGPSLKETAAYTDACAGDGVVTDYIDSQITAIPQGGTQHIVLTCSNGTVWRYDLDGYDNLGYAKYTGTIDGYSGWVTNITYDTNTGRFLISEETTDGSYIGYPFNVATDGIYPSCVSGDYQSNGGACTQTVTQCDVQTEGVKYTFVRTFIASDGCNDTECNVTYTWTEEGQVPTVPQDNTPQSGQPTDCGGQAQANDASQDLGIELDFTAYPVPFDRDVNVKFNFEFDTNVTIEIHDTKGLLVKSLTLNNVRANSDVKKSFDLSRAGDQLFYITVTTNQGSVTKKVVSSNMKIRR